jgi:hypothetical protein
LLDVRRLDSEDKESYRRRLLITAKVLTEGLTTPRALLTLAIAALRAEPCARLQRERDATIAWGMPPGLTDRCPVCQGQEDGPCPNAERRVIQAWITDNPPMPRRKQLTVPAMRFDLRLMSVDATDEIEDEGRNLVIVALVGGYLHIRIFNANGKMVVDKPERNLHAGERLTALKQRLGRLPEASGLSQQEKQKIVDDAISITGHTYGIEFSVANPSLSADVPVLLLEAP